MIKISLHFKKATNNSRIVTIKNAKFSGYYYMSTKILGEFQICVSVFLSFSALVYF